MNEVAAAAPPAAKGPFALRGVLALVTVGSAVFLLLLYAIGAGWNGSAGRTATETADSNALNGFTALADLLERRGHEVIRTRGRLSAGIDEWDGNLLVITPGLGTDPAELDEVIEARQYQGPTMVILPKWVVIPVGEVEGADVPDDWVRTLPGPAPEWFAQVPGFAGMALAQGASARWQGAGLRGVPANPQMVQALVNTTGKQLLPLVTDAEGDLLVGYWNRNGWHPALAELAGITFSRAEEDAQDGDLYPLVIVAEPDLFNNSGMADRTRARAAVAVIEAAMDESGIEGASALPIVFDSTIDGLGQGQNLLTLAFRPPFMAATLCLLVAMLVIGWRAFRRFGPPLAALPAMAHGKTQLASNGAALIQRARRWHLLGAPYAALVAGRIAAALQIRAGDETAREAAIDAALDRQGHAGPRFAPTAQALRQARRLPDVLRAAATLRSIERTISK